MFLLGVLLVFDNTGHITTSAEGIIAMPAVKQPEKRPRIPAGSEHMMVIPTGGDYSRSRPSKRADFSEQQGYTSISRGRARFASRGGWGN